MAEASVAAGIYDHCGWAAVVCVAGDRVLDRRRIELIEPGLPNFPYHHAAQGLPIAKGVAVVERVLASATRCASNALEELPGARAIAVRKSPKLPPTVAERITSYYAQTRADGVMYRSTLIEAAKMRGWLVYEYDVKTVFAEAAKVLGLKDLSARLNEIGKSLGPPWRKEHRLATAAAIVAANASAR